MFGKNSSHTNMTHTAERRTVSINVRNAWTSLEFSKRKKQIFIGSFRMNKLDLVISMI